MNDFEPSLSPRFTAYVRDYLMDRNIMPDPLFAKCGLSPDADGELAEPIPAERICRLFATVSGTLDAPYFGIELSQGYHFESSSMLIVAFMAAPTVRQAFDTLLRYDKYVDSAIEPRLTRFDGSCCWEVTLLTPTQVKTEHLAEYLMAFIVMSLRKATRLSVPVSRVSFTHELTKHASVVERFFGAPAAYCARRNTLHFDEAFLDTPLCTANTLLYEAISDAMRNYYAGEAAHSNFMEVVQRQVLLQLKEGEPSIANVASGLQISSRTLRRRLAERGVKLQDVKNNARFQRAKFYLRHTRKPLTEIAHQIGFSELSAFSRAFKSWSGCTLQAFRDKVDPHRT